MVPFVYLGSNPMAVAAMTMLCVVSPQSKSGVVPVADSLPEMILLLD